METLELLDLDQDLDRPDLPDLLETLELTVSQDRLDNLDLPEPLAREERVNLDLLDQPDLLELLDRTDSPVKVDNRAPLELPDLLVPLEILVLLDKMDSPEPLDRLVDLEVSQSYYLQTRFDSDDAAYCPCPPRGGASAPVTGGQQTTGNYKHARRVRKPHGFSKRVAAKH